MCNICSFYCYWTRGTAALQLPGRSGTPKSASWFTDNESARTFIVLFFPFLLSTPHSPPPQPRRCSFGFSLSERCSSGKVGVARANRPGLSLRTEALVPKKNEKKKSSTWGGGGLFSLWNANFQVALQHILKPRTSGAFVFQHPIISAELATPEPAMVLIKVECVGLAGNKLKGKEGGGVGESGR